MFLRDLGLEGVGVCEGEVEGDGLGEVRGERPTHFMTLLTQGRGDLDRERAPRPNWEGSTERPSRAQEE